MSNWRSLYIYLTVRIAKLVIKISNQNCVIYVEFRVNTFDKDSENTSKNLL